MSGRAGVEADIESLISAAAELGATAAVPIEARQVVLDPRVGLKCRVPLCPHYNRSFMCPPLCPSPGQFSEGLARYRTGILVQAKVGAIPATDPERDRSMRESMKSFSVLMSSLERKAHYMGYGFSLALSGGACGLCEECAATIPGAACRHPFEARPSMEAVGIDVVSTAGAVGITISFPCADPSWTGLLLVE